MVQGCTVFSKNISHIKTLGFQMVTEYTQSISATLQLSRAMWLMAFVHP